MSIEAPVSTEIANWLVKQWTTRFGEILLAMGDLQPQIRVEPAEDSKLDDALLWWEQSFTCAPDSPVWTGAPEETRSQIGTLVLAAAGVEGAPSTEVQSTFLEILRQSMSALASDIEGRIKSSVNGANGLESKPRKIARQVFNISAELAAKTVTLTFVIADDLCDAIASAERRTPAPEPEKALVATDGSVPSQTFELLLDVEMPVSVSFGRAILKLQEALRLMTGSMVELDRNLNDPVELLVNDSVIARGEVVVVDGNYGVRITEIVSQKERLQHTRRYMLQ